MAREDTHRLAAGFTAAREPRAEVIAADQEITLIERAMSFQSLMEREVGQPRDERRMAIAREVRRWGTYLHTAEELEKGSWLAWLHSVNCPGRLPNDLLQVRDKRHLSDPRAVAEACLDHLRLSTHEGRIRPLITIFAPDGWRFWNKQLCGYAGYRQADGSVVGDAGNCGLTDAIQRLGWQGPGGAWDLLPLVVQRDGERPHIFQLTRADVLEVPITHPEYAWFEDLELRWYALPAICNMALEIGGVRYTAVPFSGWYALTEIVEDLAHSERRQATLPAIAARMPKRLGRDRALHELAVAVLDSYRRARVAIVDHETVLGQFDKFVRRQWDEGREVYACRHKVVPPMGTTSMSMYHHSVPEWDQVWTARQLSPALLYQEEPYPTGNNGHYHGPVGALAHAAAALKGAFKEWRT
jgi:nitric-oxide synthase, bacterial